MDDGLDHRRDGEPPTPQLPRNERDRPHAHADAEDGKVLEHRPGRQIGDLLPMPPGVRACTCAGAATPTLQIRFLEKSAGRSATVFAERFKVVRKIESQ
jgi:hypothetical protein